MFGSEQYCIFVGHRVRPYVEFECNWWMCRFLFVQENAEHLSKQ